MLIPSWENQETTARKKETSKTFGGVFDIISKTENSNPRRIGIHLEWLSNPPIVEYLRNPQTLTETQFENSALRTFVSLLEKKGGFGIQFPVFIQMMSLPKNKLTIYQPENC